MRITLDSTVLVRANENANGPARALLLEILDGGHSLVLSVSLLNEVERVFGYPRLVKRFALTEADVTQFVRFLTRASQLVEIDEALTAPIRDPGDVHILRTAICGQVDYLCTLDRHFSDEAVVAFCLSHGVQIISDVDLLRLLREQRADPAR